jgi:hypothetical protein
MRKLTILCLALIAPLTFVIWHAAATSPQPPTVTFTSTSYTTGQSGASSGVLQVGDYNADGAGDVLVATNGGVVSFRGQFTSGSPNGAIGQLQTSTMGFAGCGGAATISATPGKLQFGSGPTYQVYGVNTAAPPSDVFNLPQTFGAWFPTSASCSGLGGGSPNALTWLAAADLSPIGSSSLGYADNVAVNGGSTLYFAPGGFGGTVLNNFSFSAALPGTLTNAAVVALADVNNDGLKDAIVGAGPNLVIFPNQNNQTFSGTFTAATATNVALGGVSDNVKRLAIADVTGDGKLDYIAITPTKIAIVVGDGTASLAGSQTSITLPGSYTGNSVTVADFNGDGLADLAVAVQGGTAATNSVVLIYYGAGVVSGVPTFTSPDVKQIGSSAANLTPVDIVAYDMNGDGHPDLVVSTQTDNNVWVLLNTFPSLKTTDAKSLQFTGVFGGASPAPVTVTIGTSDNGSVPSLLLSTPASNPNWVAVGLAGNQLTITPNIGSAPGPGIFRGTATIRQDNTVSAPTFYSRTTVNFTVTLVKPSGTLVYGGESASGGVSGTQQTSVGQNPSSMAIGDFNNDGVPDVLATNSNGTGVYIRGSGTWTAPVTANLIPGGTTTFGFLFPAVGAADFNGDGKLDAVTIDPTGLLTVAFGNGLGGFLPYTQYPLFYGGSTSQPASLIVADINNDGFPDILVAFKATSASVPGGIVILTNDGTGKFTTSLLNPGNSYISLAVADFNGDGIPDIIASNRTFTSSGFTAVSAEDLFLGKGNGVFQAPTHLTFPESGAGTCNCTHPRTATDGTTTLHTVVAGDFNGDGRPDIAFVDNVDINGTNTSFVVVALASVDGSHNVTFSLAGGKAIAGNFGSSLNSLVTGDLAGSGALDLLYITSGGTGTFMIGLIGKGDGTFPQQGNSTHNGSSREMVLGDVDGDGRLDLIGTNSFSDTYNSVFMGARVSSSIGFSAIPLSAASATTENITAQGVVTLDPQLTDNHGIGFQFVPSTAAQVTIKNGASTIGSATPAFASPPVNQTISNTLVGGVSAVANIGTNNFVAHFPGDVRIIPPSSDSTVINPTVSFSTQPSNTGANATITPSPDVSVFGTPSQVTMPVTVGLDHGSFTASSTTVDTVNGFNDFDGFFNNLKISTPGLYNMFAMVGNTLIKSNQFSITGGTATQLVFTTGLPTNTPAGVQQSVTVQAQDSGGNVANSYTGTVHFTSTDSVAVLPIDYHFVSSDNSTKTFNVTLKTTGSRTVTATDTVNSGITGNTSTTVTAGNAATVTLNSPAAVAINTAFSNLSAHVVDGFGNVVSGATVTFATTAGGTGSNGTFTGGATATTDVSGNATKVITANNKAGTFTVTATANSVTSSPSTLTINPGPVTTIAVTQGSNQSASTNAAFNLPFQVLATDAGGNPVSGYSVTFTSPSAGASCGYPSANSTAANTDATGTATVTCTANGTTGSYSVVASGSGVTSVNIVNLTNSPAAPTNINIQAGNNQSATVSTAFATALQVKVVDAGGNPISGQFVTFNAPAVGPSGTFGGTTSAFVGPTGNDGLATAPTFTANTTAGSYQVGVTLGAPSSTVVAQARPNAARQRSTSPAAAVVLPKIIVPIGGGISAAFNLTNTAGAAKNIAIVAGNNQSAAAGTAFATNLKVNVTDSFSNPVSGASVTFTPPASGASGTFASSPTVTTDASGNATAPVFTANGTIGANYTVAVTCAGTGGVNFTLSNTAGNPAIMTIVGGNGQHATVGTAFATALQVKITDSLSNALSGVSVTFTPPASGASGTFSASATVTTNASGIATAPTYTANTVAGANGLKAIAGSLNQTFNLTNDPGAAAAIVPSGTPQSVIVNTAFNTLSVKITDSFGNGVPTQSVTFTAPASGASGTFTGGGRTFTSSTDANGNLSAPTFTANGTAGGYVLTAVSGALSANFNLTDTVIPTAGIAVFSGSGQGTNPNAPFAQVLQARVFDSNGNGVPNATVTFTLPANGASGTFAGSGLSFTTTSNSSGIASTPVVTANGSQGAFTVTATTGNFSTTFTLIIGTPQGFSVAPSVLIFSWELGTPLPPPQLATVTSPNNSFTFATDVTWAKVTATPHGLINDGISVAVDPSSMAPGHYSGNVIIGDGGAILRLDLQVKPKPQINPSQTKLSFQYAIGDGIPGEQLVYITAMTRNFNINVTTNYVTQSTVQWLKLVGDGNSTTPQVLHVSIVPAGLDPGTYTANIHITAADATNSPYDIPVTLTVSAAPVTPTPPEIVGMVNSASSQAGPMAANEIVSMYGNNLGCVDGAQILVNGSYAHIVSGTYNQVNFLPPAVPAGGQATVQIQCHGIASQPVKIDLAARFPGIYARDGGSLSDSPLAPGTPIAIYGTGFNGDAQPVVTIGGLQAEILYAGPAPDLPGVTQINVRIPADAPAGTVLPVVITQDGVAAQAGLNVSTM